MRNRDRPDPADGLNPSDRCIIEESDTIPEQISSRKLEEQRALANREIRFSIDAEELACLFLEPVAMISGELVHRRPCLSFMTDVLPFVGADRASFWRRRGRAELGTALHTDEVRHEISEFRRRQASTGSSQ